MCSSDIRKNKLFYQVSETEWERGRRQDKNDDRADKRDWKGI